MKRAFSDRQFIIVWAFYAVGVIFVLRLFYLQVIDRSYVMSANNNVYRNITQYPARGLIYDRYGKLMVINEAAYDLMVIPNQVKKIDTAELCQLLGIDLNGFNSRILKAHTFSPFQSSIFEKQISKETYGFLEEKLYKYPGFFIQTRTLRKYPQSAAANILGYVGEASPEVIDKSTYYKQGDYIGISGMERYYEKELMGKKGMKIRMVDVLNREVGSFHNAKYDTAAVIGEPLYTSIDIDLQAYGELLMKNKRGSIMAIEPSTGEILAMVSSPTYDPNLLVGRDRAKNYALLSVDPLKPLIPRAIQGLYSPGSSFKMAVDLVALQYGTLTPSTIYGCQGTSSFPINCSHNHAQPNDVVGAIALSCNPFHWQVFTHFLSSPQFGSLKQAYQIWYDDIMSFGFGHRLGSDISFEKKGNIPSAGYYDKVYDKRWNAMTIRSVSIGQGEVLATPLQMANYAVLLANRGYYFVPHLVKAINTQGNYITKFKEKHTTKIDRAHFDLMVKAMEAVVVRGTGRSAAMEGIQICGKTGTSDNSHGKPHSIFIGFAPKDNPRIAICVVIENAGFGATWAGPISSLMIEKYLNRTTKRPDVEKRMIDFNMIHENETTTQVIR
jgi:penicillin-binding protein 2